MQLFFKGHPARLPVWATILHLAEMYHIPPWQFEEECTQAWWERMIEYQKIKAKSHG